ncbi:PTS sugar transporter subunit IIB [Halonatronum saccharophilum]|uniref:PTS sugar transporter subunit IIB n=1 Tax=Halonatronum saccharophilum TaxID=150060 RepID=UPI000483605B|nr:PTS sugar transporter subunit IIB [Halonatronum saccharophilum]
MKKILIVCSGGMSSAIVVKALKKEATKEGMETEIKAVGTGEYEDTLSNGWDLVLVAPQVRHRLDVFKEAAEEAETPIAVIDAQGYGPLGGPKLLQQVKELI